MVYAGGTRKNDLQLRLKYAGIQARLINSVNDMVDTALDMPADWNMYAIANYTALPAVRAALMERADSAEVATPREGKLSVTLRSWRTRSRLSNRSRCASCISSPTCSTSTAMGAT